MKYAKYVDYQIKQTVRDFTSFGNPLILMFLAVCITGLSVNLLMIIIGLVAIQFLGMAIKFFHNKDRPHKMRHTNFLERIEANSFPSIHAARSSFVFLMLFYFSNSILGNLYIIMAVVVGATRVLLRKHYVFDVIAGYVLGLFSFWLIISLI